MNNDEVFQEGRLGVQPGKRWRKMRYAIPGLAAVCALVTTALVVSAPSDADASRSAHDGSSTDQSLTVSGASGFATHDGEAPSRLVAKNVSEALNSASNMSAPTQSDAVISTDPLASNGVAVRVEDSVAGRTTMTAPVTGKGTEADHATVVYDGAGSGNQIALQPTVGGGVRASITITDTSAPTEYRFTLGGNVAALELDSNGSVIGSNRDGRPVVYVAAPWAVDVKGKSVPTHFKIDGTTLIQIVEHRASDSYPIVADPSVKWVHWYMPEVLFTRAETKTVRNPEALLAAAGTICAVVAAETLGAGCVGFAAESGAISAVASNAYGDHKCLALRYGVIPYEVNCKTGK